MILEEQGISIETSVMPNLVREIEVYENQRFLLTKFTTQSLLPTDRKAYSIKDGSLSWSTIEEAEEALSSTGMLEFLCYHIIISIAFQYSQF